MTRGLWIVLSLLAGVVGGGWALAGSSDFFRIATGPTVTTYFPIGGMIAGAISSPAGGRSCEDGGSCGVPGLIDD